MKKYLLPAVLLVMFSACKSQVGEAPVVKCVKADTVKVYGELAQATFPGKVIAASDMNLAFRVSGPVHQVFVEVGSFVKKGQVLAAIDPRDYEVQLAATEAEYRKIKNEAERIIELYEKQSITPNDYDKAVYGLQQITAKYEAHQHALADTKLVAPCDGYVQKRLFEPGETVSAGLPVVAMISTGTGEVEINIPSSEYIQREQFDHYYCTVDVFPGKTFPLELVGITRKANMNQLYTMRFRLAGNEKNMPGPGMSTMVTIQYKPRSTESVGVPLPAMFESDSHTKVWVYDGQTGTVAARTVVVAEILADGTTVISGGLRAGEVVVTAGVHSLKEGEAVKLLPAVSLTNIGGML
ncbi:MAG: efflux RND transporter periplasmic adaptor subunit [Tannerellaceae bacterium]|nr:efflux RND transporter periplasmic adaptor subunit [Tannerellaceae bacterium]